MYQVFSRNPLAMDPTHAEMVFPFTADFSGYPLVPAACNACMHPTETHQKPGKPAKPAWPRVEENMEQVMKCGDLDVLTTVAEGIKERRKGRRTEAEEMDCTVSPSRMDRAMRCV